MELLESFITADPYPARTMLFYLWGHSYEFDNNDNWDVIEKFAERAGGNSDVWYATNIEIYDYVQAYQALRVSVDESIVHNPTATKVWFCHNGTTYAIEGGQTLTL